MNRIPFDVRNRRSRPAQNRRENLRFRIQSLKVGVRDTRQTAHSLFPSGGRVTSPALKSIHFHRTEE
jgi:hypothetical protein